VADLDPDLEGEADCGSADVEDRNLAARTVTAQADAVIVTGLAGPQGVHRLARVVGALRAHGVADERILPVVNRAPRSPRARAEIAAAFGELLASRPGTAIASPVFVTEQRRLDAAIRDGLGVPGAIATTVTAAVGALVDRAAPATADAEPADEPVPVRPGSLGAWATSQEAAG
jgi:hypothetical protein